MNRDALPPLALALLAVVAIGVAAATLANPVETGGFGPSPGTPGGETDGGEWNPLSFNVTEDDRSRGPFVTGYLCNPLLETREFLAGALAVLLVLSALVYRRAGGLGVAGLLMVVLPPGLGLWAWFTSCPQPRDAGNPFALPGGFNDTSLGLPGGGGPGTGGGAAAVDQPLLLVVLVGALGVVLVAALVQSTGDDEEALPETVTPEDEAVALAAVGEAAGEAADRIEGQADLDNEVYRAWREMTRLLPVEGSETSTPAEFRAAATDAGMADDDVAALTDLFRDVRYGGRAVTDDREQEAVAALRRVEDAYADGDATGGADAASGRRSR